MLTFGEMFGQVAPSTSGGPLLHHLLHIVLVANRFRYNCASHCMGRCSLGENKRAARFMVHLVGFVQLADRDSCC
jgi:hypothetical protein